MDLTAQSGAVAKDPVTREEVGKTQSKGRMCRWTENLPLLRTGKLLAGAQGRGGIGEMSQVSSSFSRPGDPTLG